MMPEKSARANDARVDEELANDVGPVPLHEQVGQSDEELIEAYVEQVV